MSPNPSTRIIGIDPGSRITGFGVIDKCGPRLSFVSCGTVRTNPKTTFAERLLEINQGLKDVIQVHQPQLAAVEDVFVANNPRTALKLGQARGVALLTLMQGGLTVSDYPARQVKQAVVGHGQAAKHQVQHMVQALLGLNAQPSEDAADGLAVAICHALRMEAPK